MQKDKIIYEVREQLGAISDDRFVDDRYILHVVNRFRNDLIRKLVARKPYYNTLGMEQSIPMLMERTTKFIFPGLDSSCDILRSAEPVPKLIYEAAGSRWVRTTTADITYRPIELIDLARVGYITFEFNTLFSFLGPGKSVQQDTIERIDEGYYVYVISRDRNDLKYLILTGLFEDPEAINEEEGLDYPIKDSDMAAIMPSVINYIANRPPEDPLNNSEKDEARGGKAENTSE